MRHVIHAADVALKIAFLVKAAIIFMKEGVWNNVHLAHLQSQELVNVRQ